MPHIGVVQQTILTSFRLSHQSQIVFFSTTDRRLRVRHDRNLCSQYTWPVLTSAPRSSHHREEIGGQAVQGGEPQGGTSSWQSSEYLHHAGGEGGGDLLLKVTIEMLCIAGAARDYGGDLVQ